MVFDRNYFLGVLVVLVIILLVMLGSHKTRLWGAGALAGLGVGAALGWMMAKAPPGKALSGMWKPVGAQ